MIKIIARIGVVVDVDRLFLKTHYDPSNTKSDDANMLSLQYLEVLLSNLVAIRKTIGFNKY